MTKKELEKALGYYPKYKLHFINRENPKIKKVVLCWAWYPEAHKGDIFAQLSKNGSYLNIEDPNFYFNGVEAL